LRVVPETEGKFDFLCDIFCGDGHEGMTGRLIVAA
jgi:heme/copper-type cytochrome/quinol oxidase subunit 2